MSEYETKVVPLVMYRNGARIVVGTVTVGVNDGAIAVVGDINKEFSEAILGEIPQLSLGPIKE